MPNKLGAEEVIFWWPTNHISISLEYWIMIGSHFVFIFEKTFLPTFFILKMSFSTANTLEWRWCFWSFYWAITANKRTWKDRLDSLVSKLKLVFSKAWTSSDNFPGILLLKSEVQFYCSDRIAWLGAHRLILFSSFFFCSPLNY